VDFLLTFLSKKKTQTILAMVCASVDWPERFPAWAGCTLGVPMYFTERRHDPVLLPESIASSAPPRMGGLSLINHPTFIDFFDI